MSLYDDLDDEPPERDCGGLSVHPAHWWSFNGRTWFCDGGDRDNAEHQESLAATGSYDDER